MRREKILSFVLCLVFLIIISTPSISYACSCTEPVSVEEEFERSEAVFTGKVMNVREDKRFDGMVTKSVLFEVSETWKGVSQSQVIITTGLGGGNCGFKFIEGVEYLVYAEQSSMYSEEEQLVTTICDRTNELHASGEDLAILGEGDAPKKQVILVEDEVTGNHSYVWGKAIVTAGVLLFFVWRKIRN